MKAFLQQAGYVLDATANTWSRPDYSGIAYSDGDETEQRIASIIAQASEISIFSTELRQHCTDWPSLYHLSSSRANILRPFETSLAGDVLEIGAGCGAITRYLGECGANVLALEGSPRRAAIARSRTRDLENVTVLAEKFDQFKTGHQFDVVTLIGVLEYANLFTPGENPALAMLKKVRSLLKPNGKLIIAIENQLGLKYFAGAPEDHLGTPMYGVEGRYRKDQPQTFGRKALTDILTLAGFAGSEFLAPFPDYKLPASILTETGINNKAFDSSAFAWQSARRDPQLPPYCYFSLELSWREVFKNDLGLDLANSFLIIASPQAGNLTENNILAYHYSTERVAQYSKETRFTLSTLGEIEVIYNKFGAANSPTGDTANSLIEFNCPESVKYSRGKPLSLEFLSIVTRDGWSFDEVASFLRNYISVLEEIPSQHPISKIEFNRQHTLPGWYFDLVPQNIIITDDGKVDAIDTEWTLRAPIELGHLLFRSLLLLLSPVTRFGQNNNEQNLTKQDFIQKGFATLGLDLPQEDLTRYVSLEALIQKQITGRPEQDFLVWGAEQQLPLQNIAQALTARDVQIDRMFAEREAYIVQLNQVLAERNEATSNLTEIRRSTSWRITAPVRLVGHLSKGDFTRANNVVREALRRAVRLFPLSLVSFLRRPYHWAASLTGVMPNSSANSAALAAIVEQRCALTNKPIVSDPLCPPTPDTLPVIDISVVTFNSTRWIDGFIDSLIKLDYPKDKLNVCFVDNSSTDSTFTDLNTAAPTLRNAGFSVEVMQRPNKGYGFGHNTAILTGSAPFCLVTNIDLTFEPDALRRIASIALADAESTAAWELRQKPFEHPKYYDPVTGLTNWNSHACVLLRRSALAQVGGGYDETLFMYGEDVELSYRLRRAGFLLRYCPQAVVWHYSYDEVAQVKPIQYTGSTFANLYLRLKYGNLVDALSVPLLGLRLLIAREPYKGSRRAVLRNLFRLTAIAPKALLGRQKSTTHFPFRTWDYELVREGAFVTQDMRLDDLPLVSIITRTYRGRDVYLRQALLSVAHQTYPNIEHIIVEDGGTTQQSVVAEIEALTNYPIKFIGLEKVGRSAVGNAGLAAATGRWCLFLDDDDLLFAEHIEVLVNAIRQEPNVVGAYTPAWEVLTDPSQLNDGSYVETSYETPPTLRQTFDRDVLLHHNFIAIQSLLFERTLFEERGGFDEDMDALEDWVLWKRYSQGNQFTYVPKVTSLFRTPTDPEKIRQRQHAMDTAYPLALVRSDNIDGRNRPIN